MAAAGVKTKRVQAKGFTTLLTSAACEWFLIFLLLLDATLSYLHTKFASYCQLQLPCLLCTRIDNILGCDKQEFYQNRFCRNHRSEISSLVLCHIHGKVADGHRMCDDCLLSFTTSTKPNTKTHKLLVGKLGVVLGGSGYQSTSLSRNLFTCPKGSRPCVCCGKLWKSEQNAPRSIPLKSHGRAILKPYIPLPRAPRQSRLNHRDYMKKIRDNKFSESEGLSSFYPMPVGYSELKLASESESEFPFSDDDDVSSVFHENIETSNGPIAQFKPVLPPRYVLNDLNLAKPKNSSPRDMPSSHLDSRVEPKKSKHRDVKFLGSDANWEQENQKSSGSDLAELISLDEVLPLPIAANILNGESEDSEITPRLPQTSLPATLSELMTLDGTHTLAATSSDKSLDITQESGAEVVSEEQKEVVEKIGTVEKESTETDLMVSDSAPVSPRQENSIKMSKSPVSTNESKVLGLVIEQPNTKEINTANEEMELSPSHNSSPQGSNMSSVVSINNVQSPERYTEASSSNGTNVLPKLNSMESDLGTNVLPKSASVESDLEHSEGSNVTEIGEASSSNGTKVLSKSASVESDVGTNVLPKSASVESDLEYPDGSNVTEIEEASSSNGTKVLPKSASVESDLETKVLPKSSSGESNLGTNVLPKSASVESVLEYLDGSNVTEIEGESTVDQLKRQIEFDKKCLDALNKELEEERNASAIAANEAMSMITRLQEEKAALQMEALQYLRMMEEQAEYDNDELDKVNDLLTEKEKEIQDLEAELEFYRENWTDEHMVCNMHAESVDLKKESVTVQNVGIQNADKPMVQSVYKEISYSNVENVAIQEAGIDDTTNTESTSSSKLTELSKVGDEDATSGVSTLEFKEEKLYISKCLEKLEKKLHQFLSNEISSNMPNVRPENLEVRKLDQQGSSNSEEPQLDGQEETVLSIQKNINTTNGSHTDKDGSTASDSDENNDSTSIGPKSSMPRREIDLDALESEISDLNERLEALEFDRDLLEHITNSFQNGDDGKQLIQDIAHQLCELRKIVMSSRW